MSRPVELAEAQAASLSEGRDDRKAWLMLALLFVAYNFSLLDRMILSLLVDPIKASLGLTDTQVSLLQGLAFLLLYSVAGLPIGFLIDRVNRTRLIAGAVATWGLMTALCGMSTSFAGLFAARVGVGIGEAALSPGSYSLIASRFSPRRLGLALGMYSLGGACGAGLAMIIGGAVFAALNAHGPLYLPLLGAVQPWQATFLAVGLPGLLIAALIALLKEPARAPVPGASPDRRGLWAFYRRNWRFVLPLHLGVAASNAALFGAMSWITPFYGRVHDWPIAKAGAVVGSLQLICGLVGLVGGGFASDALLRRGAWTRVALCAGAALLAGVSGVLMGLAPQAGASLAALALFLVCAFLPYNVANVAYQAILPSEFRGLASAVFLLIVSVVSALGPVAVALMNDTVFHYPAGIGPSLAVFTGVALSASCVAFLFAWRPYLRFVTGAPDAG